MSINRKSSFDPFSIDSVADLREFHRNVARSSQEQTRRAELTSIVERMLAQEQLRVNYKIEALYQEQCCVVCEKKQTVFRGLFKVKQNGLRTAEQIDLTKDNLALISGTCIEKIGAFLCKECGVSASEINNQTNQG